MKGNEDSWLAVLAIVSIILSVLGFQKIGPLVFAIPFAVIIFIAMCGGIFNSLKAIGIYLLIIFGSLFVVEGAYYLVTGELKITRDFFQSTAD